MAFWCTNGAGSSAFYIIEKIHNVEGLGECGKKDWKPRKCSKLCSDYLEVFAFSLSHLLNKSIRFAPKRIELKEDIMPTIFNVSD